MVRGECHCGNVQFSLDAFGDNAVSCNCSICSRYASIWGFFTESTVNVSIGEAGLTKYSHGDRSINFLSCGRCGCVTHYTSSASAPDSKVAVNYRMFPSFNASKVMIRSFDGANTWTFID
jgi:hypothetical protein